MNAVFTRQVRSAVPTKKQKGKGVMEEASRRGEISEGEVSGAMPCRAARREVFHKNKERSFTKPNAAL